MRRDRVGHCCARRGRTVVDSRTVAVQEVLLPAVVLREVLPAAVAAQDVLARIEAEQEVLACVAPLQEVLARILVVREVLARAVDGLDVFLAAPATREEIANADRGARGVHARHQDPCTPLPLQFRRAATRVTSATRGASAAT